ncbi:MAG: ImmA/IrrE family metallo-endopeptidase [Bacteroidetes bacterium SB0662_bin_6]|nr:ImmA/IrrE family metallo-endopeptidase [Bacteroidetes bacterium SB0668_bin_1]MYE04659.1 ImmA/IrrE family metallo-endopeptidase [Bacteroidetes bacterium SB0662_bin_6]
MRRVPESEEIYKRVGRNVAERRREIRLSQTELAERCGLTRGSIANIESGGQRPRLHTLSDIAEALEVDMHSLLPASEADTQGEEEMSDVSGPAWLREKPLAFLIGSLLGGTGGLATGIGSGVGLATGVGGVVAGGALTGVVARALIRMIRSSSSEDAGEFSPIPTEELEKKAGELLQEAGMAQAPVPVDEIARYLGIRVDEADLGEDCSGMLIVRDEDGAVIGVNAKHHEHRKRFTIAHEIAHYMLHRGEGEKAYIDNPLHIDLRATDSGSGTQQEEKEANQFAAALLMPADQVRAAVAEHPFDPSRDDELPNLARRFKVSPQAMTTRLIHLGLISDV